MSLGSFSTEFKVGIFTLAAVLVVAVIAFTLEGNPFGKSSKAYYTDLENVGGVGQKTQVRTSGVPIGEVTHIEIQDSGARVHFQIGGDLQIFEGSYIELRSRGILGDVYLEIVREKGVTAGKPIPPGGLIPKVKEMDDLNALMSSIGSIAKDIKSVSNTLRNVLGNEEGENSLQNIIKNIEAITSDTKTFVKNESVQVSNFIASLKVASDRINDILERNDARVDELMVAATDTTRDLKDFAQQLRSLVTGDNKDRFNRIIAAVDVSMENLRIASDKVQLIVDKVQRGEGTIGQLVSKDDAANDLRQTLKEVQEVLRPATKLEIAIDYKGEVRSNDTLGRFGNHINFLFSTRPDRFYLLGVTDSRSSEKMVRRSTRPDPNNPNATIEDTETFRDKPQIRFNAQFSKRFNVFGVRFGLFESSAGVASDLYLFNNRLSASVEAFNFGDNPDSALRANTQGFVRLKSYANLFLTPNVYLTGGADNMLRDPGPFGFVGLGLRFTDNDIKSLFGAAAISSAF
jgi:phospholipid/cholesterol/gamma-HCH transport system substrate-binding protein